MTSWCLGGTAFTGATGESILRQGTLGAAINSQDGEGVGWVPYQIRRARGERLGQRQGRKHFG